ncbi:Glu-tRNA(Gln) amidotransferase subunit GatE [Acidianus sulfidivorans JP7]|uniref:Glutamyl-tRNA(Gln) amidotransferase subunit E n=1 Tax=Acidianus sulfidivorans JP7 TaxID=619593 RepID=A0A2U9IP58_9CREN|nr:Glu-tRNA(Gln) amidotransferase subunit GatE [Acidianus sulfidivorans]AWR97793.1 Glu-tRNA(Gln) amidotransferase subunit GatE [Acidianus sulfidivorans JP7]
MYEIDYKKIGLKVGLEIHQQLNTSSKLFCNCPTQLTDEYNYTLERYLRPVLSETGEIDVAALFEWEKNKKYIYRLPKTSSCLVESDEEPPHKMNEDALLLGLAMTLALKGNPVDEVYVMRKTVIDGSNTSGFQRTSIVGMGGYVEDIDGSKITIQTIAIEEDAARKIEGNIDSVTYNLDRLGIPLIEISTGPDIHDPEQAKRVALKIGQMLRLTGKVKRGLGTVRQDLNVSIEGGVKTEIKGVQDLDLIPRIIEYEALRQLKLLQIKEELNKRGVTKDLILNNYFYKDITEIFKNTKSKIISNELKKNGKVYGIKVPKFKGIFGIELMPDRRFGTEVSDYIKVFAGLGGLFHSDELPNYGITEEELQKVKSELNIKDDDGFIIIVGKKEKLDLAINTIRDRILQALEGVPKETRAANEDGTSRFLRPQPGSARMYPETDIPPIRISEDLLNKARQIIPPTPEQKMKELLSLGLNEELAKQVLNSPRLDTFDYFVSKYPKLQPTLIATTLENTLKYIKTEGGNPDLITEEILDITFSAVNNGDISKDSVTEILLDYSKNGGDIKSVIAKYQKLSDTELEKIIKEIILSSKDEILAKRDKAFNILMGRVMSKVRGKAEGKKVAELIKKELQNLT